MRHLVVRPPLAMLGAVAAVVLLACPEPAAAQGMLGRLKQKAKEKAAQATDRAATNIVDGAEAVVKCAAGDAGCVEKAGADGKTVVTSKGDTIRPPAAPSKPASTAAGSTATPTATAPSSSGAPGTGVWLNWDFKPGNVPLFVEDLTHDDIGDFPRRLQLIEGNMEVVDIDGTRMLRSGGNGAVSVVLPKALPDRFTLEYDVLTAYGWVYVDFKQETPERYTPVYQSDAVTGIETNVSSSASGLMGGGVKSLSKAAFDASKARFTMRLMVDGPYAKLYMGETRVANVPVTKIPRGTRITFNIYASAEQPVYVGNIRVMAGGKKLYDALLADGHVATQGIYFDTGSDRLRGESSGTLKEIAQMLQDHADLKLTIEGHTDNVGAAASNQTLSERRAAAVRAALVGTYGIDESRLTSKGLGASKPVAPNTSDEGRQQNRRVELVRVGG